MTPGSYGGYPEAVFRRGEPIRVGFNGLQTHLPSAGGKLTNPAGQVGPTRFIPNASLPVRQAVPPKSPQQQVTRAVILSKEATQTSNDPSTKLKLKLFGDTSVPVGLALAKAAQDMSVKTFQTLKRMYPHMDAEAALFQGMKDLCPSSHEHCQRVGDLALRLAREMELDGEEADELEDDLEDSADMKEAGILALTISAMEDSELEEFLEEAAVSGDFHDLGKLAIPEEILNKPSALTEEEYELIKLHPLVGETMLTPIELPDNVRASVRNHHEHWDGSGYPDGLKGTDIPHCARIIAIVDSFDAMTEGRPYRSRLTNQEALEEILRHAGTQFDPFLAEMFCQMIARSDSSVKL